VVSDSENGIVVVSRREEVDNLGLTHTVRVGERGKGVRDFVGDEGGGGRNRRETCIEGCIASVDAGRDKAVISVRVKGVARLMDFIKVMMTDDLIQGSENSW